MKKYIVTGIVLIVAFLVIMLNLSKGGRTNSQVSLGKEAYKKCQSCHPMFEDRTGPLMYGTLERIPNKDWLYKFISNPAMMVYTDAYAKCLKNKYASMMTAFKISKKEIDAIYEYIYSEAKKRKDIWQNPKFFIRCK